MGIMAGFHLHLLVEISSESATHKMPLLWAGFARVSHATDSSNRCEVRSGSNTT
jgi:hypothetical protein